MAHDIDYALRSQITYSKSRLSFMLSWIYGLKDRVQSQSKQEWSEKDEKILNNIIMCGEHHCYLNAEDISCLKSLKPQSQWKPSDEQMKYLKMAIDSFTFETDYLQKLYEDLKKLRED